MDNFKPNSWRKKIKEKLLPKNFCDQINFHYFTITSFLEKISMASNPHLLFFSFSML